MDTGDPFDPEKAVTPDCVKYVLQEDKGSNAQLVSWAIVNFTKLGDNYACLVTSIEVKYKVQDEEFHSSYVVKLNPQRGSDVHKIFIRDLFLKEAGFYMNILPEVNQVIKELGQPSLRFPRRFHSITELGNEQIYFEDLRKRNFKMFDRKKGMNVPHATLVLKELARLHAASLLLQTKHSEPFETRHATILRDIFASGAYAKELIFPMLFQNLSHTVDMLQKVGGYEKAIAWVESLKPEIEDIFSKQIMNGKYDVICHGDCWNNNILFSYNEDGSPMEVMLVDLQVCRRASPAVDLNYFMYTSLTSDVRKPNLLSFLNSYYTSFKEVLDKGEMTMPFSEEELLEEFRARNKLGAMFGMMCIPMLLMEPEEVPDMENDFSEVMKGMNEKALEMMDNHPIFRPRFLATFDEFMETGLIK